jgi:MFS family permease
MTAGTMLDTDQPAASAPSLSQRRRTEGLFFIGAAVFALNFGIFIQLAANVNFMHEVLSATPWQQGYVEAIRESCGVFSFLLVLLFLGKSEPKIAALMLLVTGVGLASYFYVGAVWQIVLASLFWSFGFHLWAPLADSMQLGLAPPGREARTLGALRAAGAAGVLAGLAAAWLLRKLPGFEIRHAFAVAGVAIAAGAVPCFFTPETAPPKPPRLPLRRMLAKHYRLYCSIEFLDGMRRQIFLLMATLLLVREHGVRFDALAVLMFAGQGLCMAFSHAAGRAVDRFGSRVVLSVYFASLAVLFVLYAAADDLRFLFILYVADSALSTLRVALPAYANRVAAPGERTQLLALGVTVNHVGAVALPLIGGALYAVWGHALPFLVGAAAAAVSVFIAQFIRPPAPRLCS